MMITLSTHIENGGLPVSIEINEHGKAWVLIRAYHEGDVRVFRVEVEEVWGKQESAALLAKGETP